MICQTTGRKPLVGLWPTRLSPHLADAGRPAALAPALSLAGRRDP